ncbi:MAG TPA: hypothetical protein PKZ84_08995 [Anaerolineae bacterium]|nr:hypothetical protein [Anaerolineae bacterium]HQI84605.1 hypothetical protein [Anaerolineae bacterium]
MTTTHTFPKPVLLKGLAVALWIVSSILALYALNAAADVVATIYAAFWAGGGVYGDAYYSAVALRQVVILPGSFLVVAVIIGGLEHHLRHVNTPGSWRLFSYVLGAEAGILLLEAML